MKKKISIQNIWKRTISASLTECPCKLYMTDYIPDSSKNQYCQLMK